MTPIGGERLRVCVVGSSRRFVSGITYYTYFVVRALAEHNDVSAILMRRLVPQMVYPGARRDGTLITSLDVSVVVPTFDGVDWTGFPSVWGALRFLRQQNPDVLLLQWWTGAVLPWYMLLSWRARRMGGAVVIELHEEIDTAEAGIPILGWILRRGLRRLTRRGDAFLVHSLWDRERLTERLRLPASRVHVIPHGPYSLGESPGADRRQEEEEEEEEEEEAQSDVSPPDDGTTITLLFFGTIRPYKGLEDLIDAFELLPRASGRRWRLVVVGETWQGWTLPITRIQQSKHRGDIELVNRYVPDSEVPGYFDRADVVVLPYLRSSASGPLHLTQARGLPVVVTRVEGLVDAATGYSGTVFTPSGDPRGLVSAIVASTRLMGRRHRAPYTWAEIAQKYETLFQTVV